MNNINKFLKANKGITLIALVITIIVLLILAGISIAMLSGNNGILQKAADAKQTSERAEAKEQAQMDIMDWITDKTANHQDASLDDIKVKAILTGKSYVKDGQPGNESFLTAKGEYEIPYSELYTATKNVPPPTIKYGLRSDGKFYCNPESTTGKYNNNKTRSQTAIVYEAINFIRDENSTSHIELLEDDIEDDDAFYVYDRDYYEINGGAFSDIPVDLFDSDGNFIDVVAYDEDGIWYSY